jgi:hypothetical protein
VDGADIGVGAFNFTQKYYVATADFASGFILDVFRASFTTNDDPWTAFFRNASILFDPGEVLFLGAEINERDTDVEIIESFSAIPNLTSLTVGGITGIAKEGHELLWIEFETKEDAAADPKRMVKTPIAVHVEQVYKESDFADLEP